MALFRILLLLVMAMPAIAADVKTDRLFQPIPTDYTPSALEGGQPFDWRDYGATATHVDRSTGWAWKNVGGDWIDRNGTAQGTANWLSFAANSATGTTAAYRYSVDVTDLVKQVQASGAWNAIILKPGVTSRSIAGVKNPAAPVINVVYADGTADSLDGLYSTRMTTSTVYVGSNSQTHTLPAVVECEKPAKEVASATMLVTVTSHPSGKSTITGNLLNPPMNNNPVEYGLAAGAPLDEGLEENPQIIGIHRYVDGSTRDQFIASNGLNIYAERDFDPFIWGRGDHDYTKLPHKDLGKWIAAKDNFQLVKSDYTGEGFDPLAPGLGAMKVSMPAVAGLDNGSIVGYSGTTASIAQIFMPEPDYALLDTLYVRYYVRWGQPLENTFSKRYEVYQNAGNTPVWTDMGGKFGIVPDGSTTSGGVSGTSGGGYGWQMRLQWSDRNPELGPPTGGGTTLGVHTYDYGLHNPVGYRYGDGKLPHMLDQQGGGVGVFWPGRWYCIEMMVHVNTVMPEAPGYVPDGEVKVWVDGRLALHMPNMVMRSLPVYNMVYKEGFIRPTREVGITNLQFNWFHGGKTWNSVDRDVFITAVAWGRAKIGPMQLPSQQKAAR